MKCLKCQNDSFDKSIILAKTLETESNEDKFEVLTCEKCHLTQWYNRYIVSGKERPKIELGKSSYSLPKLDKFKCRNCQSGDLIAEIITPIAHCFTPSNSMEGEIFLRICKNCGLSELYEIIFVPQTWKMRAEIRMTERIGLANSFKCPACLSTDVNQTGEVVFVEDEKVPQYMSTPQTPFLFIDCKKCKHMMVFAGYL